MTDIETLIERIDGASSLVVREDSAVYGLWDRLKSRLVDELQLSSDLVESWEEDAEPELEPEKKLYPVNP